jgi:hypothetical protein
VVVFFVPDTRHLLWLQETEGVAPHRVWTATELGALPAGDPLTPADLRMLTIVRREFAGEVVAVVRRER